MDQPIPAELYFSEGISGVSQPTGFAEEFGGPINAQALDSREEPNKALSNDPSSHLDSPPKTEQSLPNNPQTSLSTPETVEELVSGALHDSTLPDSPEKYF